MMQEKLMKTIRFAALLAALILTALEFLAIGQGRVRGMLTRDSAQPQWPMPWR
jgi:hypothetical protein